MIFLHVLITLAISGGGQRKPSLELFYPPLGMLSFFFDNLQGVPVRSSSVRTREAMVESLFMTQITLKDGENRGRNFEEKLTEVVAV